MTRPKKMTREHRRAIEGLLTIARDALQNAELSLPIDDARGIAIADMLTRARVAFGPAIGAVREWPVRGGS